MSAPLPQTLFDFVLPSELVALAPARPRDASRLMVLPRQSGAPQHKSFLDLPELLREGDLLVVNRTQVIPARLQLTSEHGGKVELLLYQPEDGPLGEARRFVALGRPGASLKPGKRLRTADGTVITVEERRGATALVSAEEPLAGVLSRQGEVPLPPYIRRDLEAGDRDDYQSIFATTPGAVAAPTASLHFTERVVERLRARGVEVASVTLHVGPGTFLPIREEHAADVRGHAMHGEWYDVPDETRAQVKCTKDEGRRVVAVGTTSLRALETWKTSGAASGESTLFVYPGFEFRCVDALVTNFHLPRSTLLMLVAAFAGRERVLAAYAEAIEQRYRFFSYGDAMLVA
jgi:S-adenosylmethionine:tRNA ribosyltransferase-isomerase